MPRIFDNIENHLTVGLNETIALSKRTDFCVGYFNLRGWKEVADKVDTLAGAPVMEGDEEVHRHCRLLVGMQKLPLDILREHFSHDEDHIIDQAEAVKLKKNSPRNSKTSSPLVFPTRQMKRPFAGLANR